MNEPLVVRGPSQNFWATVAAWSEMVLIVLVEIAESWGGNDPVDDFVQSVTGIDLSGSDSLKLAQWGLFTHGCRHLVGYLCADTSPCLLPFEQPFQ
jgi:hypothetical protein